MVNIIWENQNLQDLQDFEDTSEDTELPDTIDKQPSDPIAAQEICMIEFASLKIQIGSQRLNAAQLSSIALEIYDHITKTKSLKRVPLGVG